MSEVDVLFFPIRNEHGFRVVDQDSYMHMISTIVNAQVQLAPDYPEQRVMVVYEVGTGNEG